MRASLKLKRLSTTALGIAILGLSSISTAYAVPLDQIQIAGNQRIERETILSFLGLNQGDQVSAADVDAALARVYESGLFADVNIQLQGDDLVINVVENPVIAEVAFEGNKRIEDEEISKEVTLTPRSIYTKAAVQQDVKRILDVYRRSGRYSASVNPKVIQLDQNRVNLVYEIDEGEKSEISRISFVGNHAFNDDRLRAILATKETRWYRFFSSDDNYDPDRLEFDKELLRRFFVNEGYADFRVLSANAELTPDQKDFIVTFTVDEGKKYDFGKMEVASELEHIDANALQSLLLSKEGRTFDASKIEKSTEAITEFLGNQGYAFVNIDPEYQQDAENAIIGVKYVIKEGPRVYVENINITGNVRTEDQVIRREFNIAEGDPYNAAQLKRSKQKIENLGFFSEVKLDKERGSADDKVNVNVDVKEQSTGELTFGAGFSTSDGPLGDVGIQERNLLGKGQFLKLNFTLASVRQEIDLSFTEPYFLDKDFAAGFDIFSQKLNGDNDNTDRTFDDDAVGITFRGSYSITDYLRHTLRYSYRQDDITNIDPLASIFIKQQEGKNTTSLVGHTLQYDKRDNRFDPADGWFLRFNQDVAGLGGDAKFFRNELKGGYYYPITESKEWVMRVNGSVGDVRGLGEDVRINDRFFIGSNEIRGFSREGLGPRDDISRDPLGGNTYAALSAELGFPLGLPRELGFNGAAFVDSATLSGTDDKSIPGVKILDEASPRVSAGVGVSWASPLGPVRIDVAKALVKEDYDEEEAVKFSFGTKF